MKPLFRSPALVLLLALAALPATASNLNGFMPAAGEGTVALSFTTERYDEFYRGETLVSTPPALGEVDTQSLTLWARYGVTDRFALVLNVPYVDTEGDGGAGFEDSGVGDLTLLGELRLADFRGGARHTLTGAAGLRTDPSGYTADSPVSLGDGSTDALVRLVYQVEADGAYFSQQVGYDLRGDDVPDGFPLHTELGYTFHPAVTANLFYTHYLADGGTDIGDPGFTFPSNEEEYQRLGAKLYLRFRDGLGLSLSGFTTLDGRNTGDITGFSVGGVLGF